MAERMKQMRKGEERDEKVSGKPKILTPFEEIARVRLQMEAE
jgi:hypothetical protein